eukprot:scaffold43078_cov44-Tisochrysis_lutea.AAC.1
MMRPLDYPWRHSAALCAIFSSPAPLANAAAVAPLLLPARTAYAYGIPLRPCPLFARSCASLYAGGKPTTKGERIPIAGTKVGAAPSFFRGN